MSFLARWFGPKYDDPRLVSLAETALAEDPQTVAPTQLKVRSEKGVITLAGSVHNEREKTHIERVVNGAIRQAGLKHQRIDNQIEVGQPG
jgi:osmotically-inducible protein OsmY